MEKVDKKIIVALDDLYYLKALKIAEMLSGKVWGFKVNHKLLIHNKEIVADLKRYGNVFVDLKLFDIPRSMGKVIRELEELDIDWLTIHCSVGRKAIQYLSKQNFKIKLIGVTTLTTMSAEECEDVYYRNILDIGFDFIKFLKDSNFYGFTYPPRLLNNLNEEFPNIGEHLKIICPGVRLYQDETEHIHFTTPEVAINNGADYLVVGRPITKSENPVRSLKEFNKRFINILK